MLAILVIVDLAVTGVSMQRSGVIVRMVLGAIMAGCWSTALFSPAIAAVYSPQQALSSPIIQQFLANPAGLLARYPAGGARMIAEVRDLAGSDPATLRPLLELLKSADAEQATAIGTGLGQVALMAVRTDQGYATQIQEGIVAARNDSSLAAFNAAIGGSIQLTAATGGGGGGGGGGEEATGQNGSIGGSFPGNPESFITSVKNVPDNFPLVFTAGTPLIPGATNQIPGATNQITGSTTINQNVSPSQ